LSIPSLSGVAAAVMGFCYYGTMCRAWNVTGAEGRRGGGSSNENVTAAGEGSANEDNRGVRRNISGKR